MSKFVPCEYTKGKWFIFTTPDQENYIGAYDGEGDIFYSILDPLTYNNAKLMVHAPEMYEFIREIANYETVLQDGTGMDIRTKAQSILEKIDRRVSL